ncbi:PBSX family phage terminase large subunit [Tenacibaculum sp. C7A-26P2]|uniref:PBSX family phage terminase large subunit n=1 Tax=Tenacibaculum sp. C7A-26P2 TaxID=3447504 RepID=UPI003F868130
MIQTQSVYDKLYTTDKRIILLTGGRGGAKSFNASTFLQRLTFEKGHKILFTRFTMNSAELSIIPEFQEKIDLEGTSKYFKSTKKDIINSASGSKLMFRGIKTSQGNQTAKLKSIQGLTTFVVDEAEEWVNEDDYDKLRLSIRTKGVKNRIVIIMNPTDANHWVYQKYIKDTHKIVKVDGVDVQISTHPQVEHIHTTYLDNLDNVDGDFLNDLAELKQKAIKRANDGSKDEKDPKKRELLRKKLFNSSKYAYKIIGRWASQAEGVILTYTEGDFDTSLPYCYGQDFGFSNDPTTLVKIAVDTKRKKVYWEEYLYKPHLTTDKIYEHDLEVAGRKNLIMADGHEDRLCVELRKKGLNLIPYSTPPNGVREGLISMQDYEHIVTTESSNIKEEFNNYVWSDKKAKIPIDDYNHTIDAGRYAFKKLTTKKRKTKYSQY